MRRLWWVFGVLAVAACAMAQGGQGGFGGGGFGGGGFGGPSQSRWSRAEIDHRIDQLLNSPAISSILTPGEYVEWTLKLKLDQVVYADANSTVFDPALEIFDGEKVLAENDDRYPGDQRPLLLWRCEREGEYRLRVRSFRGRAGGAVKVRYRVFDTHLLREGTTQLDVESDSLLLRLPMQAKQMVMLKNASPSAGRPQLIGPTGLPGFGMVTSLPLDNVPPTYAPIAGDYYWDVGSSVAVKSTWSVETVKHTPVVLGQSYSESTNRELGAWRLDLKAGEAVMIALEGVRGRHAIHIEKSLDSQVYDLNDPERHPFTLPAGRASGEEEPFKSWYTKPMAAQSALIAARKDTSIWLFVDLRKVDRKTFKLSVNAPTIPFTGPSIQGVIQPGRIQVYEFTAKASEVYRLTAKNQNFLLSYFIVDPTLNTVAGVYQTDDETPTGLLITQVSGRHLVFVSSMGYGGGGNFSIEKTEIKPGSIGLGKPAIGSLAPGETQVWSYEAQPGRPLVVRWVSSSGSVPLTSVDSEGKPVQLPLTIQRLDEQTQISFWLDQKPISYRLVVRNPTDARLDYRIEFSDLPVSAVSSGGVR